MPRRYKLKFGGGNSGNVPVITDDTGGNKYLLIGLVVVFFIIPLIGFSLYFASRTTCGPDILCDISKGSIHKSGIFDVDCGDTCNSDTCCEAKICNPPTTLSDGYIGGYNKTIISSLLQSPFALQGVTCDTANDYDGEAKAKNCGSADTWSYTGCGSSGGCAKGKNMDITSYNVAPPEGRTPKSSCNQILIDLGRLHEDSTKEAECNKYYSIEDGVNNLCVFSSTGSYTTDPDKCIDSMECNV